MIMTYNIQKSTVLFMDYEENYPTQIFTFINQYTSNCKFFIT